MGAVGIIVWVVGKKEATASAGGKAAFVYKAIGGGSYE